MPIHFCRVRAPADGDCAFHVWSMFMRRVLGLPHFSVGDLRAVTGQVLKCNPATLQQLLCDGADQWESTVATVEKRGEYVESSVFAVVAFVLYKLCLERCSVHVHVDYDAHSEMAPEVYSFPPRAGSVHAECGWGDAVWPERAGEMLPQVSEEVLGAVGEALHMYVLHQSEPVLHFDLLLPRGELEGEERSWARVTAGERKEEWVVVEEEEKAEPSEQDEQLEEQFLWEAASDEPEDEQHTTQRQEKITTEQIVQKRAGREARMREYLQRAAEEQEKTTPSEPDSTHRVHNTTPTAYSTRAAATAAKTTATKTITTKSTKTTKTDTTLTNNNVNNALLQLLQHNIQQQRATGKRVERALALELLAAQTRKHRAALTHVESVLCHMLAE